MLGVTYAECHILALYAVGRRAECRDASLTKVTKHHLPNV